MTNSEKLTELQNELSQMKEDLISNKPSRCTHEDIEDISDNYQANLEWKWYAKEKQDEIDDLSKEIAALEKLPKGGQYDETPWSYEEASNEIYSK